MNIEWKIEEINKIEQSFSKLELTTEQHENVKFYGDFVAKFIPLASNVIQGIFLYAIKDWEGSHPGRIFAVEARGPNGLRVATEMNSFVKKRLNLLLRKPEDHERIEKAIDVALKKFAELGASRGK